MIALSDLKSVATRWVTACFYKHSFLVFTDHVIELFFEPTEKINRSEQFAAHDELCSKKLAFGLLHWHLVIGSTNNLQEII